MADITMCKWYDCPLKTLCYRYTAKETPGRQAFFTDKHYSSYTESCSYHRPNQEQPLFSDKEIINASTIESIWGT